MRAIVSVLALALSMTAVAPAVQAQTLLETVLYVLTLGETKDDGVMRTTVAENGATLRSDTVFTSGLRSTVDITRKDDCVFEVDRRMPVFPTRYTVDFTNADLDSAVYGKVKNRFGRSVAAVTIPNARYCLAAGTPYINAIEMGTCADDLAVEIAFVERPGDLERMLAAIRRLHGLCRPGIS